MTPTELAGLGDAIIKGVRRQTPSLSLDELRSLYKYVVRRVDDDRAALTVVLFEGRALAAFLELSGQVVDVSSDKEILRDDVDFASAHPVTVFGGPKTPTRTLVLQDLGDAWFIPAGSIALAMLASFAGLAAEVSMALAPLLVVSSSLFFAVFVIFGVGEVVRAAPVRQTMFRSGQLQRYLDSDRMLVRLAVVSFVSGCLAVAAGAASEPLSNSATWLSDWPPVIALSLTTVSSIAALLALRATVGYLVDRAGGSVLMAMSREVLRRDIGETSHAPDPAPARELLSGPQESER